MTSESGNKNKAGVLVRLREILHRSLMPLGLIFAIYNLSLPHSHGPKSPHQAPLGLHTSQSSGDSPCSPVLHKTEHLLFKSLQRDQEHPVHSATPEAGHGDPGTAALLPVSSPFFSFYLLNK